MGISYGVLSTFPNHYNAVTVDNALLVQYVITILTTWQTMGSYYHLNESIKQLEASRSRMQEHQMGKHVPCPTGPTSSVGGKTQSYRRVIQLAGQRTCATLPFRRYGNSRLWAQRDIPALLHLSLNVDKKCWCLGAKQWHEIKSTALATELSSLGLREAANSTETWNFPLPLGFVWFEG